jgi:4-hydroxy-tetrahydrodipicolinate synthase
MFKTTPTPLLHGIIVPMVTPLSDSDTLDAEALEQLVEHLIDGGVHGLFLLGTCGEGPSLSYRLRRELITRTCRQVAGRVPIVVSTTDSSLIEAATLGQHAAEEGAEAVVIAPPFYYPLDDNELMRFVRRSVSRSPLPVILYNMPSLTKVSYAPEIVRQLMDQERIVGLKDSSGELGYLELLLDMAQERPDWSFLVGPEHLLVPALQIGGHGGVCGGANVFPHLFVDVFEAATADSADRLSLLWDHVMTLGQIYEPGALAAPAAVKGLKSALACLGIGNGNPAEPLCVLSETDSRRIVDVVRSLAIELCA